MTRSFDHSLLPLNKVNYVSTIEEFSSKIKQIHFWYFWEKQVSLTKFVHLSMGKQNLDLKNVFAWVIWI